MTVASAAWSNWRLRLAGCMLLISCLWYAAWMFRAVNKAAFWLAVLFVIANALGMASSLLTLINNWWRDVPPERLAATGDEPGVLTTIPTCGEPTWMVERTVQSVLRQDWPEEKRHIVVRDDGHRQSNAGMVTEMACSHPNAHVWYHEPPYRGDPARRGEAKAANLNSAYAMAITQYGPLSFMETRDADDMVENPAFLRYCVGQLSADERLAFVQTVKKAHVSPGDPFNNNEVMFYRGLMPGRNATNAVFPS